MNRWRNLLLLLMMAGFLGGCAAVVALPFVAGSALFARDKLRVRAATPVPSLAARPADTGTVREGVVLTGLTALPPPDAVPAPERGLAERWQPFVDYALAAAGKPEGERQSAVLAPGARLESPARRACPSARPAVIVDHDAGAVPFSPGEAKQPPLPLMQGLARLREAGVTVLWITSQPAARVVEVAQAVRGLGLDPQEQDQFLLVRNAGDRKQVLREQANEDVCVVAIAGDSRTDFDELFAYLRNPGFAAGLYPMMGSGWFLVPPLFGGASELSEPADPSVAPG